MYCIQWILTHFDECFIAGGSISAIVGGFVAGFVVLVLLAIGLPVVVGLLVFRYQKRQGGNFSHCTIYSIYSLCLHVHVCKR